VIVRNKLQCIGNAINEILLADSSHGLVYELSKIAIMGAGTDSVNH
jgi:hypothetical protein